MKVFVRDITGSWPFSSGRVVFGDDHTAEIPAYLKDEIVAKFGKKNVFFVEDDEPEAPESSDEEASVQTDKQSVPAGLTGKDISALLPSHDAEPVTASKKGK